MQCMPLKQYRPLPLEENIPKWLMETTEHLHVATMTVIPLVQVGTVKLTVLETFDKVFNYICP